MIYVKLVKANHATIPNLLVGNFVIAEANKEKRECADQPTLSCLRNASLFSNLSEQEITCFQNAAQSKLHKKGKILYLRDESAEFFYVICSGWVKLFHTTREGEEVVVDMLTTGHMVGESAVFEHSCHTSSAQIVEDVHLLSIPSKLLDEQILANPKLALNMLSAMSRHHRRHYSQIALNAMQNAPQRVACFLLRLCPDHNDKNVIIHLPYDKNLIAYTLGMKGATFSRALNILRQKLDLRIIGTRIEIDLVEELVKFVYGSLSNKYEPDEM